MIVSIVTERPLRHTIRLPDLLPEEIAVLRRKSGSPTEILMSSYVLALYDGEEDLTASVDAVLKVSHDITPEEARKIMEKEIELLRKGNVRTWRIICNKAEARPQWPVSRIILRISPLTRRAAA